MSKCQTDRGLCNFAMHHGSRNMDISSPFAITFICRYFVQPCPSLYEYNLKNITFCFNLLCPYGPNFNMKKNRSVRNQSIIKQNWAHFVYLSSIETLNICWDLRYQSYTSFPSLTALVSVKLKMHSILTLCWSNQSEQFCLKVDFYFKII